TPGADRPARKWYRPWTHFPTVPSFPIGAISTSSKWTVFFRTSPTPPTTTRYVCPDLFVYTAAAALLRGRWSCSLAFVHFPMVPSLLNAAYWTSPKYLPSLPEPAIRYRNPLWHTQAWPDLASVKPLRDFHPSFAISPWSFTAAAWTSSYSL